MVTALTFGVEFEFSLGLIKKCYLSDVPASETRIMSIGPSESDKRQRSASTLLGYPTSADEVVKLETVQAHITQTLHAAGFPVNLNEPHYENAKVWSIKSDPSIQEPRHWPEWRKYTWHSIEITSPAYFYSVNAIRHITTFLHLLKSTYLVQVGPSTGLHVHVGNGSTTPFSSNITLIRYLHAFLFAFTPQLETLHDLTRLESQYCQSMRLGSNFTKGHEQAVARSPTANEGAIFFLSKCRSLRHVLEAGSVFPPKYAAYNFNNIYKSIHYYEEFDELQETLEFRQHAGCLDEDEVTNWIRVCVGIVDYARRSLVDPVNFANLLDVVVRENHRRKPLAEGGFTVIQLLRHIGQSRTAEYYQNRLYPLQSAQDEYGNPDITSLDKSEDHEQMESTVTQRRVIVDQGGMHPVPVEAITDLAALLQFQDRRRTREGNDEREENSPFHSTRSLTSLAEEVEMIENSNQTPGPQRPTRATQAAEDFNPQSTELSPYSTEDIASQSTRLPGSLELRLRSAPSLAGPSPNVKKIEDVEDDERIGGKSDSGSETSLVDVSI